MKNQSIAPPPLPSPPLAAIAAIRQRLEDPAPLSVQDRLICLAALTIVDDALKGPKCRCCGNRVACVILDALPAFCAECVTAADAPFVSV